MSVKGGAFTTRPVCVRTEVFDLISGLGAWDGLFSVGPAFCSGGAVASVSQLIQSSFCVLLLKTAVQGLFLLPGMECCGS